MLVTSVTIEQQHRVIWQLIFKLSMKVSGLLVISVTINLKDRIN